MRLPSDVVSRRLFLATSTAALFSAAPSRPALADTAAPTFSLKGIPGLTSSSEFTSDRSSLNYDIGVIGRGQNLDKTGRLNKCDPNKKGCISTFNDPADEGYIPPWTYQPGYSTQAVSANDARRQALREQANIEANGGVAPPPPAGKSKEAAYSELKDAVKANGGVIVEEGFGRYLRCEFTEKGTFGTSTDDVEFLISLDAPIVGYRSQPRSGGDDKRQRNRIKDIRKALKENGWKSVGRQLEGV
jgi:uncharacterized protein (DUF1499 family)